MQTGKNSNAARLASHRRNAQETLKRCPLCGAINAKVNEECYVCLWHGAFDYDPVRVEAALNELLAVCPELAEALVDFPADPLVPQRPVVRFWLRFWSYVALRTRRRIAAVRRVFEIMRGGENYRPRSA